MLLLHPWGGQGMGVWGRSPPCAPPHCVHCYKSTQPPVPVSARLMGARTNYTAHIHASFIRETHLLQNFKIPGQAMAFLEGITQKSAKLQVLQHSPSPSAPGVFRDASPFSEAHPHFHRCTHTFRDVLPFSEIHSYFQKRIPIFRDASLFPDMQPYFHRCTPISRDVPPHFQRRASVSRDALHLQRCTPIFRDSSPFSEMQLIFRDTSLLSEMYPHFQRQTPHFKGCAPILELHLKPKSQPQTLEKPSVTPCSEFTPEPPPKAISPSQWPQRTTKCLCNICRIKSCSALHVIWAGCNVAVSAWWLCTVMAVHSDGCARWWLCMVMVVHGGSCARWLCMVVVVQGGGCALCLLAMHCVC